MQSAEVPRDVRGSTARDAEHGARLFHEGSKEAHTHGDQRRGRIGVTLALPTPAAASMSAGSVLPKLTARDQR